MRWARPVSDDFHARFGARARRYRYTILNRPVRAALDARYVAWERVPLDVERDARGRAGADRRARFQRVPHGRLPGANRRMRERAARLSIARDGERITIEIQANAFLHHMVRNIVGSLLPVGRGEQPPEWMARAAARAATAPAPGRPRPPQGLTFLGPLYPADYRIARRGDLA